MLKLLATKENTESEYLRAGLKAGQSMEKEGMHCSCMYVMDDDTLSLANGKHGGQMTQSALTPTGKLSKK